MISPRILCDLCVSAVKRPLRILQLALKSGHYAAIFSIRTRAMRLRSISSTV